MFLRLPASWTRPKTARAELWPLRLGTRPKRISSIGQCNTYKRKTTTTGSNSWSYEIWNVRLVRGGRERATVTLVRTMQAIWGVQQLAGTYQCEIEQQQKMSMWRSENRQQGTCCYATRALCRATPSEARCSAVWCINCVIRFLSIAGLHWTV